MSTGQERLDLVARQKLVEPASRASAGPSHSSQWTPFGVGLPLGRPPVPPNCISALPAQYGGWKLKVQRQPKRLPVTWSWAR